MDPGWYWSCSTPRQCGHTSATSISDIMANGEIYSSSTPGGWWPGEAGWCDVRLLNYTNLILWDPLMFSIRESTARRFSLWIAMRSAETAILRLIHSIILEISFIQRNIMWSLMLNPQRSCHPSRDECPAGRRRTCRSQSCRCRWHAWCYNNDELNCNQKIY